MLQVTRIVGLEAFLVDPEDVSSSCQKMFACSTSIGDLPGKAAGVEVVVQGNVTEKLPDHLVKAYGIPKRWLHVKD